MSESYKACPICETHNHPNANVCITCGTSIAEVSITEKQNGKVQNESLYDYRYGETDLFEGSVSSTGRTFTAGIFVLGILLGIGATVALLAPTFSAGLNVVADTLTPSHTPTLRTLPTVTVGVATATRTETPTITFTPTETFTPEPCIQTVVSGDSLIGILFRCGHTSRDIIPTVVSLNGIADETRIQVGQQIIVPWPTPSPDPNALPTETPESNADAGSSTTSDEVALLAFDPFAPTATATLLPGVMWHVVQPQENMIIIASNYGADARVLSDLNPEIDFARCDFGETYGGPECIVQLSQGQRLRVPAPTPTPTIQPTASGSETPTPLPTATFNVPNAISPPNQAFIGAQEQVTLRWVSTGTLAQNEVYRVAVSDITSGETFIADSRELFLILPTEWQATDGARHNYIWQVTVVNTDTNATSYSTQARAFVWQGAGEITP